LAEDPRVLRYTPPVPEFEVLLLQCDPGDTLELKIKNVPAVFVIIEGTGTLDGDTICQPGRCYYHPAAGKPLHFAVPKEKMGPLRVAIAHKNLHLQFPTTFSRSNTPFTSRLGSTFVSPMPEKIMFDLSAIQISADSSVPKSVYYNFPDL
jgi:hypothetical protein